MLAEGTPIRSLSSGSPMVRFALLPCTALPTKDPQGGGGGPQKHCSLYNTARSHAHSARPSLIAIVWMYSKLPSTGSGFASIKAMIM
jgi:hypothetical protein